MSAYTRKSNYVINCHPSMAPQTTVFLSQWMAYFCQMFLECDPLNSVFCIFRITRALLINSSMLFFPAPLIQIYQVCSVKGTKSLPPLDKGTGPRSFCSGFGTGQLCDLGQVTISLDLSNFIFGRRMSKKF